MITAQEMFSLLTELKNKGWDLKKTPIIFDDYEEDQVFTQLDYDTTMGQIYINSMRDYDG